MTPAGWVGVWVLAGSIVVIVAEGILVGLWTARLAKNGRVLAAKLEAEQKLIEADLERLRLAIEETRLLWQPFRRILRWVRHPLVIALIGSYRARWAAR